MHKADIEIPEPCHVPWDSMRPEARGRFCFDCKKKVHDLSAMSEAEAERFLARTACEDVCVSYEHHDDGTIAFQTPPPPRVVPISRLRRPGRAATAAAGVGLAAALAACAPHGDGPAVVRDAEPTSFQSPEVVIPHARAEEAEPPPPKVDEPCETEPQAPEIRRVRGARVSKVKGRKPVRRTAGVPATHDPLGGL